MANLTPLLLLVSFGMAQAGLSSVLNGMAGKTSMDYKAVCKALSKSYQGYSWSMGGGTTTFDITCSGEQVNVVCQGSPFTSCNSASADGDMSGGCTCGADHPKCSVQHPNLPQDAWCYDDSKAWSTTHCPGSCTASAESQSSKDAKPSVGTEPTVPSNCACPTAYPSCWAKDQSCYKSATSTDKTGTCGGKCTQDASGSSVPAVAGSSGVQIAETAACGLGESLTQNEAQKMLDLHNKMRCAVGVPPLKWSGALQCQAQQAQNDKAGMVHSNSYEMAIKAGENLASGTDIDMAAWMWFTEYVSGGTGSEVGHFTAMVWKGTTELGCGIGRTGGGVIRCHYANSPGNYNNQFEANVPDFKGQESKFASCGIKVSDVRDYVNKFKGWGILKPDATLSASLGLWDAEQNEPLVQPSVLSAAAMVGTTLVALGAMVWGVTLVWRRRSHARRILPTEDDELLNSDTEGAGPII